MANQTEMKKALIPKDVTQRDKMPNLMKVFGVKELLCLQQLDRSQPCVLLVLLKSFLS